VDSSPLPSPTKQLLFNFLNLQPIPSKVHTLLGSSLGLLLVFRTNTSYGRYWEGRNLWERLHNKARDLARAVSIYEDCIGADRVTTIGRLICAYPLILREHLTGENHKPVRACVCVCWGGGGGGGGGV
jgi:predicted membrane chloride channel (bestrophin family)